MDSSEPHLDPEFLRLLTSLSNWGRWGPTDELGTLNYLTPAQVAAAAAEVIDGITVGCGREFAQRATRRPGFGYLHMMQASGEDAPQFGRSWALDWIGMSLHGFEHTHLDTLGHTFWNGRMYNDQSASLCTTRAGALVGNLSPAYSGIVGRGILLDIPAALGKPWLEPGEAIYPDDLHRALHRQHTSVTPGAMLWVRTGRDAWETAGHDYEGGFDGSPGLHASCMTWIHENEIAVLVSDVATDVRPSPFEGVDGPCHVIGLVAMGLWLVDNAALGALATRCAELRRWSFQSIIAPLPLHNATGSPVNPIAVL
jgi:kynurenine formamidase